MDFFFPHSLRLNLFSVGVILWPESCAECPLFNIRLHSLHVQKSWCGIVPMKAEGWCTKCVMQFGGGIHIENPTRCSCVWKFYFIYIWSSTCFGRHTAHHQEPKAALAASGFAYVEGCWTCSFWTHLIHCCILLDFLCELYYDARIHEHQVWWWRWMLPMTSQVARKERARTVMCYCGRARVPVHVPVISPPPPP
jgi:hypothetical protein